MCFAHSTALSGLRSSDASLVAIDHRALCATISGTSDAECGQSLESASNRVAARSSGADVSKWQPRASQVPRDGLRPVRVQMAARRRASRERHAAQGARRLTRALRRPRGRVRVRRGERVRRERLGRNPAAS